MTTQDPCKLLNHLLRERGENEWLEFKHNNSDHDAIGKYVSALANAAMLADRDHAFLVFGIENKTKRKLGTTVQFADLRKGGENFQNWISRLLEPHLMLQFLDFECEGLFYAILVIEPTYDRPVRFAGTEYIRVGENCKKLSEFPEHERALWLATGRRKFEDAIALSNQSVSEIMDKLEIGALYKLSNEEIPKNEQEILKRMISGGFIIDNLEGGYHVSNLGAIVLAKDMKIFPSINGKSVRIIKYLGKDKRKSEFEQKGKKGYAVGFSGMMKFLMKSIPKEEMYIDGIRRNVPSYPEVALREVIANALIHQDFTVSGSGPVIELYADRIEVSNPGSSLIEADRILDERRSRNEKLATTMRGLGLCEERGGGLDKTMFEIEQMHLPSPDFISSKDSMRVVLFAPKSFSNLSKQEKQRSCFYHCVLRWIKHDPMSNSSLRERFSLADGEYQAVSAVIAEAIRNERILPADPNQGNRNARYVPYWAL